MKLNDLALRSAREDSLSRRIFRQVLTTIVKPNWKDGPWVAGGSVRRYVSGLPHSDFDVFFRDGEQHQAFIERIRREAKVIEERNTNTNTTFIIRINEPTANLLATGKPIDIMVQAIRHQFYATPEAVIDSFDFTLCQWITDGEELVVGEFTLWDTARRRLALHNVTLAVSTLRRILKYSNQGFTACSGMMADFLQRVAENPEIINQNVVSVD